MHNTYKKGNIKRVVILGMLLLLAAVFMAVVVLTVIGSFMSPGEVASRFQPEAAAFGKSKGLTLIPDVVTISQYYKLLIENISYLGMFWNSIWYAVLITLFSNLVTIPAAFVFSKLKFKGSDALFFVFLLTMMMPFQVTLLPVYIVLSRTGLLNTSWALILPSVFAPFGVFLLRQFLRATPDEYVEAASLETNSVFRILFHIIIPTAKNGVIAMNILVFSEAWNMVEAPQLFIADAAKHPLSAAMNGIMGTNLDVSFAGSVLFLAPIIVLYLCFEEQIIKGLESFKW